MWFCFILYGFVFFFISFVEKKMDTYPTVISSRYILKMMEDRWQLTLCVMPAANWCVSCESLFETRRLDPILTPGIYSCFKKLPWINSAKVLKPRVFDRSYICSLRSLRAYQRRLVSVLETFWGMKMLLMKDSPCMWMVVASNLGLHVKKPFELWSCM